MGVVSANNSQRRESFYKSNAPATFEEAITATGFGKYNYCLLFAISFTCIAQMFSTTELSLVLPIAQCDLNLSLEDKGLLNAMMFAGMMASGLIWGFFCDALGRKKILVYGYLASGIFGLIAALSVNKTVLMASKFMSGLVINGPFSASTAHIAEFHSTKYRSKINMARGIFVSVGSLLLPLIAWAILPRNWNVSVLGFFVLHSWNFFLMACASTTILSGLMYIYLPESPKFLMTTGRNEEALLVMQKVFALNTGRPKTEFPIKILKEETERKNSALKDTLLHELEEFISIFRHPHITNVLLVTFNVFTIMASENTLKMWLPSIFQSSSDYEYVHNKTSGICDTLQMIQSKKISRQSCNVAPDSLSIYINTFIVAFTRILAFIVSTPFVRLLGVKTLSITCSYISAFFMTSIYFAQDETTVTILAAIGTGTGSIVESLLLALTLELFPTQLRTIAISIHLTSGRVGTLIGNIIFPYLINLGCLPPFLYIGVFALACATASFLYSSVENKALI